MSEFPAITIWQPWASLIVAGAKLYEFRNYPALRHLWGRRVAIHAGAHVPTRAELAELHYSLQRERGDFVSFLGTAEPALVERAADIVDRAMSLPRGAVLGTAVMGESRRAIDLFRTVMDPEEIDPDKWAWPMSAPHPLDAPAPVSGERGWWKWRAAA